MSFYIPEQLEEEKAVENIYNNAVGGVVGAFRCRACLCFYTRPFSFSFDACVHT